MLCQDCGTTHKNIRQMDKRALSKVLAELALHFWSSDERDIAYLLNMQRGEDEDWLGIEFSSRIEDWARQIVVMLAAEIEREL